MPTLHPILLSGGSGTRLWPLSRKSFPKQFVPLLGERTLFQVAAARMHGATGVAKPIVITNSDFRFIVTEQLAAAGIDPGAVLIEPEARNTGPAILAAAQYLAAIEPDALMLVMPTDHDIPDLAAFRAAVAAGVPRAEAGMIVTFGIRPDRPETGYGWLELAASPQGAAPLPLIRFVEKPDLPRADAMLKEGRYLWNAGIFLMSAETLIAAFLAHAPDLIDPVGEAVGSARPDLGFLRLATEPWSKARAVSVDYAVMEKATNLEVVPFEGAWSDMGDWNAVWRDGAGEGGIATRGPVTMIDCEDSLIRSESEALHVVGIGLRDVMVVAMPDAVLVADRSRAQEVKDAVALLKAKSTRQAEIFPRDHRPWGWFETLVLGDRFQVKRIVVHPGAALSLQSHVHRAEHWIVVSGTARVTVEGEVKLMAENESVYVPLGARHRLENPGKVPMVLIEIQTGAYLGEDDIIRYEDIYSRGGGAKG
ncbi:mannose-1-phosphate guanylyltransferase/mannose-6-phosphate isomerase [Tabrizicola sp.]|uniref:mannose-1-phosphate guanylyltransferase/mannose-6-phosphate isomerase n=1 Tax=Tabrizicola sp. TaxID=2005166 RepID=UPI00286AC609|nr:mannose-1-phosphate guanylyltransferase/mannose-6-phosphate isomerase [Tabrizicola sp.]